MATTLIRSSSKYNNFFTVCSFHPIERENCFSEFVQTTNFSIVGRTVLNPFFMVVSPAVKSENL